MAYVLTPDTPLFKASNLSKWNIVPSNLSAVTNIAAGTGTNSAPFNPEAPNSSTGVYSIGSQQEWRGTTVSNIFTGTSYGSKSHGINATFTDRIVITPSTTVSINVAISLVRTYGGNSNDDWAGGLAGLRFVTKSGAEVGNTKWVIRRINASSGDVNGGKIGYKNWAIVNYTATAPENAYAVEVFAAHGGDKSMTTAYIGIQDITYTNPTLKVYVNVVDQILAGQTFDVYSEHTALPANVESVTYYATNTATSDVTTLGTSTVGDTFTITTSLPKDGTYTITAKANLGNSVELQGTRSGNLTIGVAEPTTGLLEYNASNAYAPFYVGDFSNIAAEVGELSDITGAELYIDYSINPIIRCIDKGAAPEVSSYNVALGTITAGQFTVNVVEGTDVSNDFSKTVDLALSDFTLVSDKTSDGMRWASFTGVNKQVIVGNTTSFFGISPFNFTEFAAKQLAIRWQPVLPPSISNLSSGDACYRIKIDRVALKVYFSNGTSFYYIKSSDGSIIKKVRLNHYTVDSGDLRAGTAEGVLYLSTEVEDIEGSGWFGDGSTFHSDYPTNENKLADLDSLGGLTLPSYSDVYLGRSRYQFVTNNFYGDISRSSIYGVSGQGRAFCWNPSMFYYIHTQPDADKDMPRHVSEHATHLALGFLDGRVDISVIGSPHNYSGLDGASSWTFSSPITGLIQMNGTMLGVLTSRSIDAISGTTVDNFAQQRIVSNKGAIEYTLANMGTPVFANVYGIYTLSQAQQYGDYLGTPLSQDISPWLRPRLKRSGTSEYEVVCAWPVRSKNQYRLAFSDGYILTMTLNGAQATPTFSKQMLSVAGCPNSATIFARSSSPVIETSGAVFSGGSEYTLNIVGSGMSFGRGSLSDPWEVWNYDSNLIAEDETKEITVVDYYGNEMCLVLTCEPYPES